ncbi:SulP family inorganic anion transporter [Kitasatospora sp. NPDC006697]|uniref:SulP family inorganic anion transporter n=1 Tax=Kitasatospora sp. NPDC006697 TaxID=3364020 RepID=UPI003683A3F1
MNRTPRLPRLAGPKPADVTAGLVTGLFSIPEGMAYAAIAGFNPVAGLFSGVVPAIVGSLTARTVLMVTTLTSAISLTAQSVLADAGLDPASSGNIAMLAVMTGLVMLLMGVLRLGVVLSFVSNAVMTGFSVGIAVQIVTGVLNDATGYKPHGHNKLTQLADWMVHVGSWQLADTLTAAATIGVWAIAHAVKRLRTVALLIAMAAVSIAVALLGTDVELVKGIADIPSALPHLTAPQWSAFPHLIGGAVSIALVALAQAAGISPTVPNPDGSKSDANRDFTAQGLANVAGGLFQSLPVGGSLSRTGVAVSAGARTRWAGIFSGLWLAAIVLTLAPLAEHIPMPVIGGLIIVVGAELITGKIPDIRLVLKTSPLSTTAMALTFLATTQLPLQQAIILGAVLSLLLYCAQAARQGRLLALQPVGDGHWTTAVPPTRLSPGQVTVLDYNGVSLFAELPRIERDWPAPAPNAVLILVVRNLPDVPSSAMIKLLRRKAEELHQAGGRLILAGVQPPLAKIATDTGLADDLGPGGIMPATGVLFGPLESALHDAGSWLSTRPGSRPRPRPDTGEQGPTPQP